MSDSVTLTATFKNKSGAILTGLVPDGWNSTDPTVAPVSPDGVVTALQDGTAIITAKYQSLTSNPCVVTVSARQIVDTNHPNEPNNMFQLSPTLDGTTAPPAVYTSLGWVGAGIVSTVDTIPGIGSTDVLHINYPAGSGNGTAPGRCWSQYSAIAQDWPQFVKTIYASYLYTVSPGFPASLNANKMMYLQINHANSFVVMLNASADQGTEYTAPIHPRIILQNIKSANGNPTISQVFDNFGPIIPRGQYFHVEAIGVANTAGNADGSASMYVNGSLVLNIPNVAWDVSGAAGAWNTFQWDPVYNLAVPSDSVGAYHRLKNLYVSGRGS